MPDQLKKALEAAISEATRSNFTIKDGSAQGGGCINEATIVSGAGASYFVKLNSAKALPMFEAEREALSELAGANAIRVPQPLTCGTAAERSYLVLEALAMGPAQPGSWKAMGQQLARLHRTTAERFGWHRDNVIGSTPQRNGWNEDWTVFFREQRLRPQFDLARRNGFTFAQSERLLEQVPALLGGHHPRASLLHGDLWSGNANFLGDGTPVIFDPATYYGDRETDLAFSEFFGGFHSEFYAAYEKEWPLSAGYETRKILYNLYHVLNHANLFGGGYASQAERMIRELIHQ